MVRHDCEAQSPATASAVAARLAALWIKAEQAMAALDCGTVVSHEAGRKPCYDPRFPRCESVISLEWTPHDEHWRLCRTKRVLIDAEICTAFSRVPVAECPVDEQTALATHLEAVRARIEVEAERRWRQVSDAIEFLEEAMTD